MSGASGAIYLKEEEEEVQRQDELGRREALTMQRLNSIFIIAGFCD